MGWKNWPSWVKGGIIGLVIYFILGLIIFFINPLLLFNNKIIFYIMGFPTIYITAPLLSMFINNEGNNLEIIVKGFFYIFLGMIIAAPVNGFFIGAIIGFIIGKIKSKNTQNINNQNIIKRR